MRSVVDLALNASQYKQLPDLVYIFTEISSRLDEARQLLREYRGDWRASERLLRRCDELMQEAEVRLDFLQAEVWNMVFMVGRDEKVVFDEGEVCERAREAFRDRWLGVLPHICFAGARNEWEEKGRKNLGGRRWVSY